MRNFYQLTLILFTGFQLLTACSTEEDDFLQAASLKVVHAASGAPAVHVDYFGPDVEDVNFVTNPALAFGSASRFTLPANASRELRFTYASDTTTEVFTEQVTLGPGSISTFFLLGDSALLSSIIINDQGHRTFEDSLNAVRFINMADGVVSVNVGIAGDPSLLASDLLFAEPTPFIEVDATLENERYRFTFKNDSDSVIASYDFEQYRVFNFPGLSFVSVTALRKNVTLALVGRPDDGSGNSTLRVVQIDNF